MNYDNIYSSHYYFDRHYALFCDLAAVARSWQKFCVIGASEPAHGSLHLLPRHILFFPEDRRLMPLDIQSIRDQFPVLSRESLLKKLRGWLAR